MRSSPTITGSALIRAPAGTPSAPKEQSAPPAVPRRRVRHPREKAEYGKAQHEAWELSMRAHAVANGVYVAAVNRVGHEGPDGGGLEFWGASFVCDPFGTVVRRASHDREELLVVTCDRARMEDVRRNWPFFRDRRIDAYEGLGRRVID